MDLKHSPAPWGVVRHTGDPNNPKPLVAGDDWTICSAEGKTICFEAGGREVAHETEANVRLIIAAPEMLAVIREGIMMLEGTDDPALYELAKRMKKSIQQQTF